MFKRSKRWRNPYRHHAKSLRVERLEPRHMLSGVVDVVDNLGPGDLHLNGDVSNNDVEVRQTSNASEYVVTGLNGTLLTHNGGTSTSSQLTVNSITDDVFVRLEDGNDTFRLEGRTGGQSTTLPSDLRIFNDDGSNTNILQDGLINGDLLVSKVPGTSGFSELQVLDSTVIGDTRVNNQLGGGGGASKTLISNSHLQAGGPIGNGLWLRNGAGDDIIQVEGDSQFGRGVFPAGFVVVDIVNSLGPGLLGGSRTTFAGNSTVWGAVTIANGRNLPGTLDIVTFNQAQVVGFVAINNFRGSTETFVINSQLGTHMAPGIGGPLTVFNDDGFDAFLMQQSQVQWGVAINNDVAAGGTSTWGSSTGIHGSSIGTHFLAPFGLIVSGDNGADTITINPTTIGSVVGLTLGNGNNDIALIDTTMSALTLFTGTGNDSVLIENCVIPVAVIIFLDGGADTVEIRRGSILPDPAFGILIIDGGLGLDRFGRDSSVSPLVIPMLISFEVIIP